MSALKAYCVRHRILADRIKVLDLELKYWLSLEYSLRAGSKDWLLAHSKITKLYAKKIEMLQ